MKEILMQYWIQAAFAVVSFVVLSLSKKLRKKVIEIKIEQEAQARGIQALLRDRIVEAYYKYYEKEEITQHGLENVHAMFSQYKTLGGNGTICKLVKDMEEYKVIERK